MPELPEVEVLVRSLAPLLRGRVVAGVHVYREKILRPSTTAEMKRTLLGARFTSVRRRGKYLLFDLLSTRGKPFALLGHLGMTGRMYLLPRKAPLPKHAALVLELGPETFVFEDTRYFGRVTLDTSPVTRLGAEPLGAEFTAAHLREALSRSAQPIKVKLLDQSVVAGIGNIYASEALFRAGISPKIAARRLTLQQAELLVRALVEVLEEAIRFGSTVPLNYAGSGERDGLFYFGTDAASRGLYEERLRVYDRANQPCPRCKGVIRRLVQAGRSTFYCAACQKAKSGEKRSRRRVSV